MSITPRRIDGIDLSHYQAAIEIDYAQAKAAGVKFMYHKATEGVSEQDVAYPVRRAQAQAQGLPFGGYHYAHPEPGNAATEAAYFLAYATPTPGDLVPVLDLEVNEHNMSEDELAVWVHTWFMAVYAYTGTPRGLLYTKFNLSAKPPGVRAWVARFNNDNRAPVVPKPFLAWSLWQFSDGTNGTPSNVPGVGHVDTNTIHRFFPWARLGQMRIDVNRTFKKPSPAPVVTPPPAPKVETPAARVVRVALGQVGYHEGRSNGHWDNIQKYSPAVASLAWSNGQPWCATFVSWVAQTTKLSAHYPCTASTIAGAAWFKARGQWSEYPAIAAQVYFQENGKIMHTGLVYKYDAKYVYTVEGNTNTNGSAEGDGVYLKKHLRTDPYVLGYGYPVLPGGLTSADPNYKA